MYMFIHVYVYVSIVYMLCSPMLEEIKNLISIDPKPVNVLGYCTNNVLLRHNLNLVITHCLHSSSLLRQYKPS